MNRTEDFPMDINPVRDGVYGLRVAMFPHVVHYSLWKDGFWHFTAGCTQDAAVQDLATASAKSGYCQYSGWFGAAAEGAQE